MAHRSRRYLAAIAAAGLLFGPAACREDRGGPAAGAADAAGAAADADPDLSAIVPTDPPPLGQELGDCVRLISSRRTGAARIRLKKHLALHPDDVQALFLFGLTYHEEKKYDQARQWYAKALAADRTYSPIYHFEGWAAYYLGQLGDARRSFRIHLAYQPREADSHFGLGVVALEEGELDEAETHFLDSIELLAGDPSAARDVSKARARLGDVQMQRGDLEAARAEYEKSVQLYPDHYEVYHKLAQVYERLGMPGEAEVARRQFAEARTRVHPEFGDAPDGTPDEPPS